MKRILVFVTFLLFAIPVSSSASVSSSSQASGSGTAAAVATDGTKTTASVSSKDSDTTIASPKTESIRSAENKTVDVARDKEEEETDKETNVQASTCSIQDNQYSELKNQAEKISLLDTRTVKLLNLFTANLIGIGIIITLLVIALIKSRRNLASTSEEALNKF